MKAKNFKNGAVVEIKPNAGVVGVMLDPGTRGVLTNVTDEGSSWPRGQVHGWLLHPEHVSLVERAPEPKPETLAPGFYTDRDGDLWIAVGDPVVVINIVGISDIERGAINAVDFGQDGVASDIFLKDRSDRWPLTKVADLPKPISERGW